MQTRQLGKTDLDLSVIGLGTWAMGGGDWLYGWGDQDDEASVRTIYRALDMGINWLDTAAVYGLGRSESVIGRALDGMRDKPYIATKCSRVWDESGQISGNLKRDSVIREAEDSLRRLRVEIIDLYQIHWPNPKEQMEEGWEAIQTLIQQGKVRYGGVSNFSMKQIQQIQPFGSVASLQPPYSMLKTRVEDELLPFCLDEGIGIIVYSPMQKGLLSGKMTVERAASFPENDHRLKDTMFQEPELSINLELVEGLRSIAGEQGITVAQLAIAWVLRQKSVTSAIVGGRKPSQVEEIVAGFQYELDTDLLEAIDQLLVERKDALRKLN